MGTIENPKACLNCGYIIPGELSNHCPNCDENPRVIADEPPQEVKEKPLTANPVEDAEATSAEDEVITVCRNCGHAIDQADVDNGKCPFCDEDPNRSRKENSRTPLEKKQQIHIVTPNRYGFR